MRTVLNFLYTYLSFSMVFSTLVVGLLAHPSIGQTAAPTVGYPTSIGFQGRLKDDGGDVVADATYDFRFQLFDEDTDISALIYVDDVSVVNGYFSLAIPLATDIGDLVNNPELQVETVLSAGAGHAGNTYELFASRITIYKTPFSVFTQAIQNSAADPASAFDGEMYYDTDDDTLKYYNGTSFVTLIGSGVETLNSVYANTGASPKLDVDDAGGLEFESTVAGDIAIDLQSTGDFVVQNAGVTFATFSDDGDFTTSNTVIEMVAAGTATLRSSASNANLYANLAKINIMGGEATADAVNIWTSDAAGGIDIDAGTTGIAMDATGGMVFGAGGSISITSSDVDLANDDNIIIRSGNGAPVIGPSGNDINLEAEHNIEMSATNLVSLTSASGLTLDSANTLTLDSAKNTADAIVLNASDLDGGIDVNAGTSGITMDSTGAISIDAGAASNFSTTNDVLTFATGSAATVFSGFAEGATAVSLTAGDLVLTDGDLTLASGDLDVTGATFNVDATGAITLDAGATSHLATSVGNLTISTSANNSILSFTAGDVLPVAAADGDDIELLAEGDIILQADGAFSIDSDTALDLTNHFAAADAISLTAANVAGGIDINAGSAGITLDSTGSISIDAAGASNLSTSAGDLSLVASTNSVSIVGAEAVVDAIHLDATNAVGGITLDSGTGGVTINSDATIALAPTGDITNTLGAARHFYINASTTPHTESTYGALDVSMTAGDSPVTHGSWIHAVQNDAAGVGNTVVGERISLTQNDADGLMYGLNIGTADGVGVGGTFPAGILVDNGEDAAGSMLDGIRITSSGVADGVTDGIDVSDANITNALNLGGNIVTGTDYTLSSTSDIFLTPTDTVDTTLSATGSFLIDASSTAHTGSTNGALDISLGSITESVAGARLNITQNDGAAPGATLTGEVITLQGDDANGFLKGLVINSSSTLNAAAGTYKAGIEIYNLETTSGSMTDGIILYADGGDGITDGLDVSDANITNAINIGANAIAGTNFSVNASGNITGTFAAATNDKALCHEGGAGATDAIEDCTAAATADYAEKYPTAQDVTYGQIVVPGTTMIATQDDSHGAQQIAQAVLSSEPYQGPIYGIVSNNYGDFTSAGNNIAEADHPMPVALVGRVPVSVVAENGLIAIGDFLATSSTPGAAMKATQAGRVIGMALENWNGEKETVMVQVINTWYQPPVAQANELQGGNANVVVLADAISASDASFSGSVTVAEHLYGSRDMAGRARLNAGDDKVRVSFETDYLYEPVITFSPRSEELIPGRVWVSDEDRTGFTLNHSAGSTTPYPLEFNWIAMGVEEALVSVSDGTTEPFSVRVIDEPAQVVEEDVPEEIVEEVVDEPAAEDVVGDVVEEVVEAPAIDQPAE